MILPDTPVKMTSVTFVNFVFEFPVSSWPSPYIQRVVKLLLASNLKTTSIPNLQKHLFNALLGPASNLKALTLTLVLRALGVFSGRALAYHVWQT